MAGSSSAEKRSPGRPWKVDPHVVVTTAGVYRAQLAHAWPLLGKQLLAAKSASELWEVVKSGRGIISPMDDFIFAERIFEILNDPHFPQLRTRSQIHFLADSLGGCGVLTPRRAREICAKERSKKKYIIVRRDFYIECTCGYEGPALNGACQECGTLTLSDELKQREENEY
jgi:hypothetical protein